MQMLMAFAQMLQKVGRQLVEFEDVQKVSAYQNIKLDNNIVCNMIFC